MNNLSPLSEAVDLLRPLEYDQLRDLRDLLRNHAGERVKRHGLPPLGTLRLSPALSAAYAAGQALPGDQRAILLQVIGLLHSALAPQVSRQDGRGYIELKYQKKLVIDGETMEIVRDADGNPVYRFFGPYAYLRLWATGGDKGREKERLQNVYLGRPIGEAVSAAREDGNRDLESALIDAWHAGGRPAVNAYLEALRGVAPDDNDLSEHE